MCVSTSGPYREIYHTTGPAANISFYLADPADSYWQSTFISIANGMRQAGVDGTATETCQIAPDFKR
jgi:hypothetical protein